MEKTSTTGRISLAQEIPLDKPLIVYISPCNVCNFRCRYCCYSEFKESNDFSASILSLKYAEKIISNIKSSFYRIKNITLTSAETLLNPNIAEIINLSKTVADKVRIITNGSMLTKEMADSLIKSGLDTMTISINGLSDNDYFENTGTKINFDDFCSNIRYLKEQKTNMQIHIKIIDYMIKEPNKQKKFFSIFSDLGDVLTIEHLGKLNKNIDYEDFTDKDYEFNVNNMNRQIDRNIITCPISFYALNIHEDGNVAPCCGPFIKYPVLGNAFAESLIQIWDNSKNLQYKMLFGYKTIPECSNCLSVKYSCTTDSDYLDDKLDIIRQQYEKAGICLSKEVTNENYLS